MILQTNHYPAQHGFTLIEIAMVLFIATLLLTSLVPVISSQVEQKKTNETRQRMNEIRQALIGYAIINGRLPCPAVPTIATGATGAGTERATCTTSANATGVLPWATLGTSETDGWDKRFSYRVTTTFADTTDGTGAACAVTAGVSFQLCSVGSLTVMSAASAGTTVASSIPAVIISHGKNGAGAYTQQGTLVPVGSNADELENSDGSTNSNYVSHIQTSGFDDQVVWITPGILYNRMVAAGKLP